jgi:hypothetical protein
MTLGAPSCLPRKNVYCRRRSVLARCGGTRAYLPCGSACTLIQRRPTAFSRFPSAADMQSRYRLLFASTELHSTYFHP